MDDGRSAASRAHGAPPGAAAGPGKQQQPTGGFVERLQALPAEALDRVLSTLSVSAVARARLACKGLRDAIDSCVLTLNIAVRTAHLQRWAEGQPPPSLDRWRRCTQVSVRARGNHARLLLLPFMNMDPLTAARISGVSLSAAGRCFSDAEDVVAQLPGLVPSLRRLSLCGLGGCMSQDPLASQLMFRALAALPLEELRLPTIQMLERLGPLTACPRLRLLEVSCIGVQHEEHGVLTARAVECISHMPALRELQLSSCTGPPTPAAAPALGPQGAAPTGALTALLDALPPSLTSLTLGSVKLLPDYYISFRATLQQGRLTSVCGKYRCGFARSDGLSALARLLCNCRAMPQLPQRLATLSIGGRISVGGDGAQHQQQQRQQEQLAEQEVAAARLLAQRCDTVQWNMSLAFGRHAPVAVVMQLLEVVGWPKDLLFSMGHGTCASWIGLQLEESTRAAAAGGTAAFHPARASALAPAADALSLLPSRMDVLCAAMRRWHAASTSIACFSEAMWFVLLRGPGVEDVVGDAQLLDGWVRQISDGRVGPGGVVVYQGFPPAGALVLGVASGDVAAETVMAATMGGVALVARGAVWLGTGNDVRGDEAPVLHMRDALQQEIQAAWDAAFDPALPPSEQAQLLSWVMRVLDMVRSLPAAVWPQ